MGERVLLGMLTPSSNTVLEPLTSAILSATPEVTAHFGRFRVTEIALNDQALGQFDAEPVVQAARLLADAKVQVIAWNGTSGGWLGFAADRHLCTSITAATGVPATTSTLAMDEALKAVCAHRYGLVTPYLEDVQSRIVTNFEAQGYACAAECHLGRRDNFSFSEVSEADIECMVRKTAESQPDAIVIFCTNLRGARLASNLEDTLGIPILDSVSVTIWHSLLLAGADPARITGWGQLFAAQKHRSD